VTTITRHTECQYGGIQ